jgi:hypothetical protein
VLFDGNEGERLFWKSANCKLIQSAALVVAGGIIFIPEIAFDIGLKITQTRFKFDKGAKYLFIFAVEDCIRRIETAAKRQSAFANTKLMKITVEKEARTDALQNGSIMTIEIKGVFDFS